MKRRDFLKAAPAAVGLTAAVAPLRGNQAAPGRDVRLAGTAYQPADQQNPPQPFSVSSVLSLLALLGVSVETAVILVSYINKLRVEHADIRTVSA